MSKRSRFALIAFAFLASTLGLAAAQDYRYYDRGDYNSYRSDRDDFRRGMQVARSIGFEDGEQQARTDILQRKPFNPYPRGHNHSDRGYARDFGNIEQYRENYSQAYNQGYSSIFHRDRFYR